MTAGAVGMRATASRNAPTLNGLLRYFAHLGTVGFGGPVVLVERMRRDLQEERGWYTAEEYKEGLALAQLAPGPLAAQLAIYLGWVRAGFAGATLVAFAFIAPSFVMVLALSAAYLKFGGLPWMLGAFYGIGAAVIAVIAHSAWRFAHRTVGRDHVLWLIVAINATITAWMRAESVWMIAASGAVVVLLREPPSMRGKPTVSIIAPAWLLTGIHGEASGPVVVNIVRYFATAGVMVFGSGLAIVPFLHGGVVQQMHWLDERQFLDAVAVSMITPGPVVITVAFIGYLVAGPIGAGAAALGVFVPVYVIVVLFASSFHRWAVNRRLRAMINGVTAAATGAIIGAVFVLGQRALTDLATWIIGLVALALLLSTKRVAEPVLIVAAGVVGIAIRGLMV